jgi:hypothetical protein
LTGEVQWLTIFSTTTIRTAEEDSNILHLLHQLGKGHLWAKIKEDGSLAHRGNSGIKVHLDAMVSLPL